MKTKIWLLVTLLVLCCSFASAVTFGFGATIGGSGLYCNYEALFYYGGGLWGGFDNLSACGNGYSYSSIVGFSATASASVEAHGKGVVYGDAIYNIYFPGDPGNQWTVFTKLKCNKKDKSGNYVGSNGWEGVAAITGFFAGISQGPLSCDIPGKNGVAPTRGVSTGAVRKQPLKK